MQSSEGGRLEFGDYTFDVSQGTLWRNGQQVKIQPQPLMVLRALVAKRGETATREELRSLLWGNATHVDFEQGLNFCIRHIRVALNDNAREPKYVETLPKQGYRLIAPVSAGEPAVAPVPDGVPTPRRDSPWKWVAAGVIVVSLAAGALIRMRSIDQGQDTSPSIVVLPLINRTGDAQLEYLADGITSDIIRRLALVPGLKVISRTSAMSVKMKNLDVRSAATLFGVNRIIAGSIQGSARDLTVDIEVADARDSSVVLSRTYSPGTTDLAVLGSTVAEDIVHGVKLKLSQQDRATLRKQITTSAEALDLYMRAEVLLDSDDPPKLQQSVKMSSRAVQKDPKFALALKQEAGAETVLGLYYDDPRKHLPRAKEMALHALSLDDTLAETHGILGVIALTYDWDFREAERQLILATGRMNHDALEKLACVTHLMASTGRATKGEDEVRAALKENPLATALLQELGCNAYYAGQYERALIGYRRALETGPGSITALWGLGKTYAQMGKYEEALGALNHSTAHGFTPPVILSELGYVYGRMGNAKAARDTLHRLNEMSETMFVDPFFPAVVELGLGDLDATFRGLNEAYNVRSTILVSIHSDPKWAGLRKEPRFQQLENQIGFGKGIN
jgi:TolB-like protein/DNA-binding winged helix-turn-helix (wHTH) protein/tetratricopeptide (TPR) repeat protein